MRPASRPYTAVWLLRHSSTLLLCFSYLALYCGSPAEAQQTRPQSDGFGSSNVAVSATGLGTGVTIRNGGALPPGSTNRAFFGGALVGQTLWLAPHNAVNGTAVSLAGPAATANGGVFARYAAANKTTSNRFAGAVHVNGSFVVLAPYDEERIVVLEVDASSGALRREDEVSVFPSPVVAGSTQKFAGALSSSGFAWLIPFNAPALVPELITLYFCGFRIRKLVRESTEGAPCDEPAMEQACVDEVVFHVRSYLLRDRSPPADGATSLRLNLVFDEMGTRRAELRLLCRLRSSICEAVRAACNAATVSMMAVGTGANAVGSGAGVGSAIGSFAVLTLRNDPCVWHHHLAAHARYPYELGAGLPRRWWTVLPRPR